MMSILYFLHIFLCDFMINIFVIFILCYCLCTFKYFMYYNLMVDHPMFQRNNEMLLKP